MINILGISGSLRHHSTNRSLLGAAAILAPAGVALELYEGLGELPHFNPDRQEEGIASVIDLKQRVRDADGLLISSPEYAHGIPGAMKNALDWLVSGDEFPDKPVAFLEGSTRGEHARAALTEVIRTMSATIVEEASISVHLIGTSLDGATIAADPNFANPIRRALIEFARAIESIHATPALQESR